MKEVYTVEINDVKYKVEYKASSFIRLRQQYGIEWNSSDFEHMVTKEDPNLSLMFTFILLGLIKHHNDEDLYDIVDNISYDEMAGMINDAFAPAFRASAPDNKQMEASKNSPAEGQEEPTKK